jgi:hypothetical protein
VRLRSHWAGFALLLATALHLQGCGEAEGSATLTAPMSADISALHGRCVEAMVRNACTANGGPAARPAASPVVMIAGVGAVDARFYATLQESGDRMCGQIVQPCSDSWDGNACRTARALWPATSGPQGVASSPSPVRR